MSTSRDDLGAEGNAARRRFWEMCAAAALQSVTPWQAAEEADYMLAEWDRRWTAEKMAEPEHVDHVEEVQAFLRGEGGA